MIESPVVVWAGADRQADQLKGAGIVSDGLSHCCSTPNPLHQTWAHTQQHGEQAALQQFGSHFSHSKE